MIAAACAYSFRSGNVLEAESDGVRELVNGVLVTRQEMPTGGRLRVAICLDILLFGLPRPRGCLEWVNADAYDVEFFSRIP